jgi:hypothetical protein
MLLAATVAAVLALLLPGVAQAYYVDISITGAGRVYETTDANELDEHCPDAIEGFASSGTTPTGTIGATCRAGDASGDYGWGWVVRYVAEPAAGYRFDGWHSDGRTNPGPVICDGSNSGAACQFATHADLQLRARFVDDAAPAMSSLTGPNQVVNGPASFTFGASADPTFRLFECRVAGVHDWQTCSSGRSENPPTGSYTFEVRAVDWSGNRSSISTWGWTVDKVAPETSLINGPSGTVASTAAQFDFTSNESGSFICTLDGVAVACGSPKTYSALAQGQHTFTVRARDVAGNEDSSPSSRTWTVDTVAPNTTLAASGPAGATSETSATFSFSSEAGASFRCQLDAQPVDTACASPRAYAGLDEGPHTFKVWARDGLGNEDPSPATRSWTVLDTTPPDTAIDSGPGQGSSTESTSATFAFSSGEPGAFECALDGGAFAACGSPRALSGLAAGSHTFRVRALDAAGNPDPTPATRTWVVTAPPQTSGGGGPTGGDGGTTAPTTGGGTLAPFSPGVVHKHAFTGRRTRLTALTIRQLPADAKVQLRCSGGKRKGCKFKRKSVGHAGGDVKLAKLLRKLKLKKGAAIELRVTAASGQVKLARYVIRRGKAPKVSHRCAVPGGALGACG